MKAAGGHESKVHEEMERRRTRIKKDENISHFEFPSSAGKIWPLYVTDRQTNSLTPYTCCGFFLSVKFATALFASLAGGLRVNYFDFGSTAKYLRETFKDTTFRASHYKMLNKLIYTKKLLHICRLETSVLMK